MRSGPLFLCVKCFLHQEVLFPEWTWTGYSTEKLAEHSSNYNFWSNDVYSCSEISNHIQNQYCGTFHSCKHNKKKGLSLFNISCNLKQRSFLYPKYQIVESSSIERSLILYSWIGIRGNFSIVHKHQPADKDVSIPVMDDKQRGGEMLQLLTDRDWYQD